MKQQEVVLSLQQAERLGIITCKHCGYPPNNHFAAPARTCAHDLSCPGFEPKARIGVLRALRSGQ